MKYMKTKLKALSPIIATILLVVVAVILVSVILSFGKSFTAQGLDKTKDIKELSKSDAEHFIYPKTFSNGVIQFNYSPPNNSFGEIQITKYKILYDNNETENIILATPYTLKAGTNFLNLENFSSQNITANRFTLILETEDGKYITLRNIINSEKNILLIEQIEEPEVPENPEEPEIPEGIGPTPVNGEIWYLEHLAYINTNADTLAGTYTLMRNLDFLDDNSYYDPTTNKNTWTTGEGFTPIGTLVTNLYFRGTFDGNNFTISNLYINRPTTDYVGLFGYTSIGSTINNLDLEDVNVIGLNYVGGLVGSAEANRINNVFCSGLVLGNQYVGGFVGSSGNVISRCSSDVSVSGNRFVGGFVGISYNEIINCYSLGDVTRLSGTETIFGGFLGRNYGGTISNNYSTGRVIYAGEIDPTNRGFSGSSISGNNYWDMNTSLQTSSGGGALGKTTTEMKTQSTFTDWNFNSIWAIDESVSYPYLRNDPGTEKEIIIFYPNRNYYEELTGHNMSLNVKLYNSQGDYNCVWNSNLIGNFSNSCISSISFGILGSGDHIITVSVTDNVETLIKQKHISMSIESGCSFIYSFDGEKYNPEQAISDFAVHKEYEYPTYGILRTLENKDNHYKLGIWEKVPETQYIDTIELWKLIHPKDTTVIAEQTSGVLHTIKEKEYPIEATGIDNQSYLSKITQEDDDYWVTNMNNFDYVNPPTFDELYLRFPNKNSNNEKVKLVVRAKDTGLLSSDWRNFVTLLDGPDKRGYEYLNSENDVFEDLTNYIQNTGLLYVYQKINGEYQLVDSFRFGNVEFYHTWAIEIQETEEPIELKLVGLPYAHQIDEVYLDRSIDEEIEIVKIKGNITETNTDYLASEIKTLADTRDYDYFKLDLGDYILLDFYDDSNITLTEEQTYTTLLYADAYSESYSLSNNEDNIVNKKDIDLLKEIISTDTLITKLFTRRFYENNPLKTSLPSVYKIG